MIKSLARSYDEKEEAMKKILKTGRMVFAVAMLAAIGFRPAAAQDSMKVAPLQPVPNSKSALTGDILLESEPGENFHGQGPIQRVEEGKMVIGDVLWTISPTATYFKKSTNLPAQPREFAPGEFVGYYVNATREIVSLWLIDPPRE